MRPKFLIALAIAGAAFVTAVPAQTSGQLALADILIALRSKKVSIVERNDIISKAVTARGVTFELTPEIEKELADTGADQKLVEAIRSKSHVVKVAAVKPQPETKGYLDYLKQGDADMAVGDADSAVENYDQAAKLEPRSLEAVLGRAAAQASRQMYDLALADYEKVLAGNPVQPIALAARAEILEKKGKLDLALIDQKKLADTGDEKAKAAVARLAQLLAPKVEPAPAAKETAKQAVAAEPAPEYLQVGKLSRDDATTFVLPFYPELALRANIVGEVTVAVTLDADGKVVEAKAASGPVMLRQAAETAALRSKFKPATYKGARVKGKGSISYNFKRAERS